MGVLDALLPRIGTGSLAALLARCEEERPEESLFFALESEFRPHAVARSVAAFANASGGFIIFGAKAGNGRLLALPGLASDTDWRREVASHVVGHVSPLPAWAAFQVPSPQDPERVVVVVRVEPSRRAPHIECRSGVIYVRSPGGTTDPVTDRATLDVLIERGRAGDAAVNGRAAALFDRRPPWEDRWQFFLVTVPLPYGSAFQHDLLTERRCREVRSRFGGGLLLDGAIEGIEEEGFRLGFGAAKVGLYQDGSLWAAYSQALDFVPVTALKQLAAEVLVVQRGLPTAVHEARVFFSLLTSSRTALRDHGDAPGGGASPAPAPRAWVWKKDVTIARDDGIHGLVEEFARRLWRAHGEAAFDPP